MLINKVSSCKILIFPPLLCQLFLHVLLIIFVFVDYFRNRARITWNINTEEYCVHLVLPLFLENGEIARVAEAPQADLLLPASTASSIEVWVRCCLHQRCIS